MPRPGRLRYPPPAPQLNEWIPKAAAFGGGPGGKAPWRGLGRSPDLVGGGAETMLSAGRRPQTETQSRPMRARRIQAGVAAPMSEIADRIKKIVVEHLGVEEAKVTPEASFIDDLGADSLDTVELVMAFEEAFSVEIPEDAAEKISTVKDAIDYIEKQKAA